MKGAAQSDLECKIIVSLLNTKIKTVTLSYSIATEAVALHSILNYFEFFCDEVCLKIINTNKKCVHVRGGFLHMRVCRDPREAPRARLKATTFSRGAVNLITLDARWRLANKDRATPHFQRQWHRHYRLLQTAALTELLNWLTLCQEKRSITRFVSTVIGFR